MPLGVLFTEAAEVMSAADIFLIVCKRVLSLFFKSTVVYKGTSSLIS